MFPSAMVSCLLLLGMDTIAVVDTIKGKWGGGGVLNVDCKFRLFISVEYAFIFGLKVEGL
jgi:hypothetical protein